MSLRAGRVGVASDQVDEFGKIKSEATSGYTKQEADAKFETKTDAAAALAEKQPITLAVPIEMLSGTKLTVEDALQGLNNEAKREETQFLSDFTIESGRNHIYKKSGVVEYELKLNDYVSDAAYGTSMGTIPEGFRPVGRQIFTLCKVGNDIVVANINTNGQITINGTCPASAVWLHGCFIQ